MVVSGQVVASGTIVVVLEVEVRFKGETGDAVDVDVVAILSEPVQNDFVRPAGVRVMTRIINSVLSIITD